MKIIIFSGHHFPWTFWSLRHEARRITTNIAKLPVRSPLPRIRKSATLRGAAAERANTRPPLEANRRGRQSAPDDPHIKPHSDSESPSTAFTNLWRLLAQHSPPVFLAHFVRAAGRR